MHENSLFDIKTKLILLNRLMFTYVPNVVNIFNF